MEEKRTTRRVLNLYSGIGGNRLLWPENLEVVAVEIDPQIASIYSDLYPKDEVIVADAHEFLLHHFREFDFIWSSPPCTTHTRLRYTMEPVYPDMTLYQEIILLQHHATCPWVVENVISYYDPLIPAQQRGRHYFWANFYIPQIDVPASRPDKYRVVELEQHIGISLADYDLPYSMKRKILRNCVYPRLGLHVLQASGIIKNVPIQQKIDYD